MAHAIICGILFPLRIGLRGPQIYLEIQLPTSINMWRPPLCRGVPLLLGVKLFMEDFLMLLCRYLGGRSGKYGKGNQLYNKTALGGIGTSSIVRVYVKQNSLIESLRRHTMNSTKFENSIYLSNEL